MITLVEFKEAVELLSKKIDSDSEEPEYIQANLYGDEIILTIRRGSWYSLDLDDYGDEITIAKVVNDNYGYKVVDSLNKKLVAINKELVGKRK